MNRAIWPNSNSKLVGAEGFEPPTLWSQTRCATRLRYAPTRPLSHYNPLPAMQDYVGRLLLVVDRAEPRLRGLDDAASARRPSTGKWSPREIVGHLIDSASNNPQRFVRAQFQDDLGFPGYAQDDWVTAQRYQEAPFGDLVALWAAYNRHLARVMVAAPKDARTKPRRVHNLHQLAWNPVPQHAPATLDYFMRDYVGHLEHHLKQIFGPEGLE